MVVLTIVTEKNGETLFFADPIPQGHFINSSLAVCTTAG